MMLDIWQQLQSFMGRGGPVLWVILAYGADVDSDDRAAALLNLGLPAAAPAARPLAGPQRAPQLARSGDSRALAGRGRARLNRHLIFIRTLVVLCPMLGCWVP